MRTVRFYFDYISPYAGLALLRADAFAREHSIAWDLRPVVFGAVLDATGLVGPAEVDSKRRSAFLDVMRCAELQGERFVFPPAHPFKSLAALRLTCLHRSSEHALPLAAGLVRAAWCDGRDLTDLDVLSDVARELGLPGDDLGERLAEPAVKQDLRTLTEDFIERGGHGVPTFEFEGELFWGQDRLDHLAARLDGRLSSMDAQLEDVLARPRGADRAARRG
ncbi:MAG: 2-hydroxychromene-2-carboxylate isomerase [Acidobacteriota bacterium]